MMKGVLIAAVFNTVTAMGAVADTDNSHIAFTGIDKDYIQENYHRRGDNTDLAKYLSDNGLFPHQYAENPDEGMLRRSVGFALEEESNLRYLSDTIINKAYKDIVLDGGKDISPSDLHDLQLSLKFMGYTKAPISGNLDSATIEGLKKYAPVHDEMFLKTEVGAQIPISFENGIVKPNVTQIGEVLYTVNEEALSNRDITADFGKNKLTAIIKDLADEYSKLELTHPELQDGDIEHIGSAFHYIMTNPHEYGGSIKERLERRLVWESVRDAIEDNGGSVSQIRAENKEGQIRETWTRDHVFILGDNVFVPDIEILKDIFHDNGFSDKQVAEKVGGYRENLDQTIKYFQGQGYNLVKVEGAWFEGGNIVTHGQETDFPTLFMGIEQYDGNSTVDNTPSGRLLTDAISATVGKEWSYLPVPLKDTSKFYHLDLGMPEELRDGQHFITPDITDAETYKKMQEIIGADKMLEVDSQTTDSFAINMVIVDNTLITSANSQELKEMAEKIGYKVVAPAQYGRQSFIFNAGGAHCLTNKLQPS